MTESRNKDIISAPKDIGKPIEDASLAPGPQERVDTCAIRAQQHVLSMYGIDIPEVELVKDAIAHGEYSSFDDCGTLIPDVGNLLERNGINVHRYQDASVAHLISELSQGHKIIVGIDANEVLASSFTDKILEKTIDQIAEVPNHAVVVVNVDPHTFDVDIVDPADGKLHRIPAKTFADAWKDSNCFMVATDNSPSEVLGKENSIMHSRESLLFENDVAIDIQKMEGDNEYSSGTTDVLYNDKNAFDQYSSDIVADTTLDINGNEFADLDTMMGMNGVGNMLEKNRESLPQLGSLGHVAGVTDDNMVQLGSLGHVAGVTPDVVQNESNDMISKRKGESLDRHVLDLSGNGIVDTVIDDVDGDGTIDIMSIDTNNDGQFDSVMVDINGDGNLDTYGIDIDGDEVLDVYAVDTDGDGKPDALGADIDGDGAIDEVVPLD